MISRGTLDIMNMDRLLPIFELCKLPKMKISTATAHSVIEFSLKKCKVINMYLKDVLIRPISV